jgi:5-methylcytosine-specific restriction endonuclease McrA
MPFVNISDIGTTPRKRLSAHRRLQIWEWARGICVLCQQPIEAARERWIIEHIRALELGGDDTPENMGPAHATCAQVKTRDDHRRAAKAKRQKIKYIGAERPRHPLPCGKRSPWKRKLDGTVVPRK